MMNQRLGELKKRVDDFYNEFFIESSRGKIQRIISTDDLICFAIRFAGITVYLYLGRGNGVEGIWVGKTLPPSEIRRKDRFLEYLRKHFRNANISKLEIDEGDRIINFSYNLRGINGNMLFFWKGQKLYFADVTKEDDKYYFFLSWEKGIKTIIGNCNIPECFDSVGRRKIIPDENQDICLEIDEYLKEKLSLAGPLKKTLKEKKKNRKKAELIENDLHRMQSFKSVMPLLEGNFLDLQDKDCFIKDNIKVKFGREWNIFKKKDAIYNKIKRLKKAEIIQLQRLKKCQKELDSNESIGHKVLSKIVEPVWYEKANNVDKNSSVSDGGKEFPIECFSIGDTIKFIVGKNARANDYIRKIIGKKNDYWIHVDGYKGAHGILKGNDAKILSLDVISLIGSILKDCSNLNILDIPLVYTQVQNVKGVKGVPGKVIYKKEKHIVVRYMESWKEKTKEQEWENI